MKLTLKNIQEFLDKEPASLAEVECGYLLDETVLEKREELLKLVLSKIQYDGTVIFQGLDIVDLARRYEIGEIDDGTYLKKIYSRRSAGSLEQLRDFLLQNNFQLLICRLDSNLMEYYIHAKRNK